MLVSVIIPTYNSGKYISSAIESVINQTYPEFELLIIDDGSTDNTEKAVKAFNDNRIKYIFKENAGVAAARNTGLKEAKGEYIAFLDADDCWKPEKLKVQLDKISNSSDICMVYSAFEMIYKDRDYTKLFTYTTTENNFIEKLLTDPFKSIPYPSTVLIKKSYLDKAGIFNPEFPTGEDWDLWLKLAKLGKCSYMAQPLMYKLTHNESITNSLDLKTTGYYHFKLLDKFFTENPEYEKLRSKAYSVIYYDIACRTYGRNDFKPSMETYLNLLRSFITYPPLYFTRLKMGFLFKVLIKDNLKKSNT